MASKLNHGSDWEGWIANLIANPSLANDSNVESAMEVTPGLAKKCAYVVGGMAPNGLPDGTPAAAGEGMGKLGAFGTAAKAANPGR